jgi:DNA repair photolyase
MTAFDPRTAIPGEWSLRQEDTQGLILWTKNPTNLLKDAALLKGYPLVVHVTLTGWGEVEKNAPDIHEGIRLLKDTVRTFGVHQVVWRFTPIPQLPTLEILDRFTEIAEEVAKVGVREVYTVFLQPNDRMPETRTVHRRHLTIQAMARSVEYLHILVLHCKDDQTTLSKPIDQYEYNLDVGVCEDGRRFGAPPTMDCGCCLAVDPFTINETCALGCKYCYAADKSLSAKKRNTTLRVLP